MEIIYSNRHAARFMARYQIPPEIKNVTARIFEAIDKAQLHELFPGEIVVLKKLEGFQSSWTFRLDVNEGPKPFVSVCIIENPVSNKLDFNRVRQQFKLTRRETDVLRRVTDGLSNRDIAEDLDICGQTVKDHLSKIYMKMQIKNRFALVRFLLDSPDLYAE
jgi:DNA-binding NarL/FixJ family response regulator